MPAVLNSSCHDGVGLRLASMSNLPGSGPTENVYRDISAHSAQWPCQNSHPQHVDVQCEDWPDLI